MMHVIRKKCWYTTAVASTVFLLAFAFNLKAADQAEGLAEPPAVDVLGAHDIAGRGCAGCHVPHNDQLSGTERQETWLWGTSSAPEYGQRFTMQQDGRSVEVDSSALTSPSSEVSGVLLCISCHDGNITPQNMMASRSYDQKLGVLPYVRRQSVRTLLSENQFASLQIDHPLGVDATIETGNGLEFADGKFTVQPDSAYAHFVASYGWPTLAPRDRSNPYGVDADGRPYLVCTTCHNQHAMSLFVSQPGDTIASDGGGQVYSTYFFVNGPYTRVMETVPNQNSAANVQFCRQCHFNLSNEGNGALGIPTVFR